MNIVFFRFCGSLRLINSLILFSESWFDKNLSIGTFGETTRIMELKLSYFFFSKFLIIKFPYKKLIITKIKLRPNIKNFVKLLYLKKNITGNKNIVIDNKFSE